MEVLAFLAGLALFFYVLGAIAFFGLVAVIVVRKRKEFARKQSEFDKRFRHNYDKRTGRYK